MAYTAVRRAFRTAGTGSSLQEEPQGRGEGQTENDNDEAAQTLRDLRFLFASGIDEELDLYVVRDLSRSKLVRALRGFQLGGLTMEKKRVQVTAGLDAEPTANSHTPPAATNTQSSFLSPSSMQPRVGQEQGQDGTRLPFGAQLPSVTIATTSANAFGPTSSSSSISSRNNSRPGGWVGSTYGRAPPLQPPHDAADPATSPRRNLLSVANTSTSTPTGSVPPGPGSVARPRPSGHREQLQADNVDVERWMAARRHENEQLDKMGLTQEWLEGKTLTPAEQRVYTCMYGAEEARSSTPSAAAGHSSLFARRMAGRSATHSRPGQQLPLAPTSSSSSLLAAPDAQQSSSFSLRRLSASSLGSSGSRGRPSSSSRASTLGDDTFQALVIQVFDDFIRANKWSLYGIFTKRCGLSKHYLMPLAELCRVLEEAGGLTTDVSFEMQHAAWVGTLKPLTASHLRKLVLACGTVDRSGCVDYRAVLDDQKGREELKKRMQRDVYRRRFLAQNERTVADIHADIASGVAKGDALKWVADLAEADEDRSHTSGLSRRESASALLSSRGLATALGRSPHASHSPLTSTLPTTPAAAAARIRAAVSSATSMGVSFAVEPVSPDSNTVSGVSRRRRASMATGALS